MSVIALILLWCIFVAIFRASPLVGIIIVVVAIALSYLRAMINKAKVAPNPTASNVTPVTPVQTPAVNSHDSQHSYSWAYSAKKSEPHNTVTDKPLSEAERNVLYGK